MASCFAQTSSDQGDKRARLSNSLSAKSGLSPKSLRGFLASLPFPFQPLRQPKEPEVTRVNLLGPQIVATTEKLKGHVRSMRFGPLQRGSGDTGRRLLAVHLDVSLAHLDDKELIASAQRIGFARLANLENRKPSKGLSIPRSFRGRGVGGPGPDSIVPSLRRGNGLPEMEFQGWRCLLVKLRVDSGVYLQRHILYVLDLGASQSIQCAKPCQRHSATKAVADSWRM